MKIQSFFQDCGIGLEGTCWVQGLVGNGTGNGNCCAIFGSGCRSANK